MFKKITAAFALLLFCCTSASAVGFTITQAGSEMLSADAQVGTMYWGLYRGC